MDDIIRVANHRLLKHRPIFPSTLRTLLAGVVVASLAFPVSAGSVNYTYDTLGRLQTATYNNGAVITYSYDAAGNRSSQVTIGAP